MKYDDWGILFEQNYTEVVYINDQDETPSQDGDRFKRAVTVDGRRVTVILLETGSARTMVRT